MPLRDRYEVLGRLGGGAFGEVFLVHDRRSDARFAAKCLRVPHDAALRVLPAALFQELEALRQLTHPNIVALHDVVADGSSVALVLELVDTDLATILRGRETPLTLADVRGLLRMLLLAVAHCHARGVAHRDLKPANVLITRDGELKLSDFGLAAALEATSGLAMSPQVATRWYRSPELLLGAKSYDGAAVDLWAVGVLLAELLTLTPLFPGHNDLDQLHRILQVLGHPEPEWPEVRGLPDYGKVAFPPYASLGLAHVLPDIPLSAVDLLSRLLTLNPSSRLSAREALQHEFLFDGPLNARFSFGGCSRPVRRPTRDVRGVGTPQQDTHEGGEEDEDEDDAFLASLGKPLTLLAA